MLFCVTRRAIELHAQFRDMLPANLDPAFVPAGGGQVPGKLHPQPRLLRAAEGFAEPDPISGLMPDLPLMMLLRVCRVTPGTFAPAVTERPKGSANHAGQCGRDGAGFQGHGVCLFR
jgi:hypothetical protein